VNRLSRCAELYPVNPKAVVSLHAQGRSKKSLQLCRFLDAGNDETLLALRRPASKKRQGTKSREVRRRRGSER
jgi:hypothetical protein